MEHGSASSAHHAPSAVIALGWALALALSLPPLALADDPPSPFTEEALARGLDFTMSAVPQAQGYLGQGCGFVDLDGDGDPDVVILGRSDGKIGIFENIGGGFFVDHTLTSGIAAFQEQAGFAAADYDADGLLDLYVTQSFNRPNVLLRNLGSFTFSNVTAAAGVGNPNQNHTGPSWGDYNNDGWPDLYVSNYGEIGKINVLFRNNGNGTFTNVTVATGVGAANALSFQSVWSDYDRDGDVDLYLSNDRGPLGFPPNVLWRNNGGTGFTDVSAASGAGVSIYSMGIAAGDVDGNLYPDYYLTNVNTYDTNGSSVPYDGINPLLLNQGNGTFVESAEAWGVDNRITSWGTLFFDWDNDGHKDLYVNNQFEAGSFFHCTGAPPCTEMAAALGIQGAYDPDFELPGDPPTIQSFNSAVADVDGDGDLDLLLNNLGHRAELFINHEGDDRSWVRYRVVGVHPNRFALGVGVVTTAGGHSQFHESYAGGNNYLGQSELDIHVGLGDAAFVDQASFRWPSNGPSRTLGGLPAGQTWTIYPPARLCDADGDGVDHDDFEAFADCFLSGFVPGCEMMDWNGDTNGWPGDSRIWVDDLDACFVSAPADCNGNGTEDLAEIVLDLGIDVDDDSVIDCCEGGPVTEPNAVGATLLLGKSGPGAAILTWTAPPVNAGHAAAGAYDVFRATGDVAGFAFHARVTPTTYTDADTAPALAFYLVSARNSCGSSGEEPF